MLMVYEEIGGFKIADVPMDETRVPRYPIENRVMARPILALAENQRPDVKWKIVGKGPYGVYGE